MRKPSQERFVFIAAIRDIFPTLKDYVEDREKGCIDFNVESPNVYYASLLRLSEIVGSININFTGLRRDDCDSFGYGGAAANIEIYDVKFTLCECGHAAYEHGVIECSIPEHHHANPVCRPLCDCKGYKEADRTAEAEGGG